ncbi:MAG: PepSY-associated TM helix domain-containing protein [Spongiibacter marinus]|uniref:PepSY-associated TM helix domain-containing protein n=1 Tax=Spongiibacter TaxID=630749 RepID=UPI000C0951EF|nr:PepSY-associated TM helix domain-containing protein [Spongiibacter sp.]MAK44891.1 hypothetical protein [Spongiibacter sp.]
MNKWLFKWHSWLALAACLPLVIICATGSVLVFKHEIDRLLMPEKVRVEVAGPRQSLDALQTVLHQGLPNHEIVGWTLFGDPQRADQVYVIAHGSRDWLYTLVDPYRGEILAPAVATDHYLSDWLLELHYTLLLDDAGIIVSAVVAVVLCLLGISGLILHRRFWKNLFTLRRHGRRIVYYSDLHKLSGALASPVLLVLGITGGYWNIAHSIEEYQEHADGHEHPIVEGPMYSRDLSLDALLAKSQAQLPGFTARYVSLPWEPGRAIRFWGDVGSANPLLSEYASSVGFNADTGEALAASDIRTAGVGAKVLDSFRRLHFGNFAGLTSRVIWSVLGLAPLLLAFTGGYLWLTRRAKRRRASHKRRSKQRAAAGVSTRAALGRD